MGALCGLASLSLAADVPGDAERLLRHALRQSEHLPLAYRGLGPALLALGRVEEADAAARHLMKIEPENPQSWITMAAVASRFMRQEQALEAYERAAQYQPGDVRLLMSIGHVRKSLGRRAGSEASYKQVLAADPGNAEAWWSLADLKNYSFDDAEVAAMQRLIAEHESAQALLAQQMRSCISRSARLCEQRGQYAQAFAYVCAGQRAAPPRRPFRHRGLRAARRAHSRLLQPGVLCGASPRGGDPSSAPIFIVGLPRSGSTLIEQILASHSQVDGTMELPNIVNLVREFEDQAPNRDGYPEAVGGRIRPRSSPRSAAAISPKPARCGAGARISPTSCPIISVTWA